MKRPIIETERLVLRPFVISDADAVYAYCSDPQVARFTSWEPHRSAADSESFIRFCTEHFDLSPDTLFVPLAICVRDGPAVGSVTLAATEAGCRVDFALARHLWNEGLVTEAARAMIDWAFDSYPELKVVESGGMSANPASMRVMEKLGMTQTTVRMIVHPKFEEPIEIAEWQTTRDDRPGSVGR